jgi:hypothetical protein
LPVLKNSDFKYANSPILIEKSIKIRHFDDFKSTIVFYINDFLILTTYPVPCELDDNAALPNNYPIENIITKNSTNTILGYYQYLYSSDNYNMELYDWMCTVLHNVLTINRSAKISDVKTRSKHKNLFK